MARPHGSDSVHIASENIAVYSKSTQNGVSSDVWGILNNAAVDNEKKHNNIQLFHSN